jgi:hypothetical protein
MAAPGDVHALVAVRAKDGETTALTAVTGTEQLGGVQVLIEHDPRASAGRQHTNLVALTRHLGALGRPPMIDVADVVISGEVDGGPPRVLGDLVDELTDELPPAFVPVVRGDASDAYAMFAGQLCGELGAGAALRVRPWPADKTDLQRILDRLRLAPSEVDLVVDWRYLDRVDTHVTDSVLEVLERTASVAAFRSTTLLSGSVPLAMQKTAGWHEPRLEESLWQTVRDTGLSQVRFGDYGVAHPITAKGYRSHHVTVKYTCASRWLYLRERMAGEQPRARTLRALCNSLVADDSFAGPDFSWGDSEIQAITNGGGANLGNASTPIAIATSHHLAYLNGMTA